MANILLLQTDRQLASNASQYFKAKGHDLSFFSDPQKAVTAIDQKRPDLIIIDLFLAARSAIEFLFELRSYPEWESIPTILTGGLSAAEVQNYQKAFDELHVETYIQKTSTLEELKASVEHVLQTAAA